MRVRSDRAFHTPDMAGAAERFAEAVAAVERRAPRVKWLSNVSGSWITAEEAVSARYWADQMTARVRFRENAAVLAAVDLGPVFLLEVGPGDVLAGLVKAQARVLASGSALQEMIAASSLGGAKRGDDYAAFLEAAARLWTLGVNLDWSQLPGYSRGRKTALPTYAFERERFWVEASAGLGAMGRPDRANSAATDGLKPGALKLVRREDMASWFYSLTWRKTPRAELALPVRGEQVANWVAFDDGDPGALGLELIARVEEEGARVWRVTEYSLGSLEAFWKERLSEESRAEGAWGLLDLRRKAGVELEGGWYGGVLRILQTAMRARVRFAQVEMIAAGLVEVLGERVEASGRGIVEGLVRMLPAEMPGTRVRVIDPGMDAGVEVVGAVVAELKSVPMDGLVVALRNGMRWQEEWMPVRLEGASEGGHPSRFRHGGVYLITGGLGGVGFVLARYLLKNFGARVALVGRTKLPPRESWEGWLTEHGQAEAGSIRIARVKELEEAAREGDGRLMLLSADVADRLAMAGVWVEVEAALGTVNGVVHAAGLTSNERVMVQTAESVERVLLPKVQGSEVVGELSAGKSLDFLLFCSSISAVHPVAGAAPYAAGNAFQDRYAVWLRRELGVPAVSINLDTWREVGMAADIYAPEEFAGVKAALMAKAMSPEEGIEAIERVLASGEARILTSTIALEAVFAETAAGLARASSEKVALERSGKAAGEFHESELGAETRAVMEIWQELLGVEWVRPGDNFFELGGHSLLGTMVLARVRERFGVELTIRAIFEAPTPASLGERIREAGPIQEEPVSAGGEREEFEI